jgi:hypothetical protein
MVIATLFKFGQSVDFHLHDTYFVISNNYFFWALGVLFFIAWAIYVLTEKFLWTKKLTWTHVLTTMFVLLLLSTIDIWHDKIFPPIKRDAINFTNIIVEQKRERIIAYPMMAIFVFGQATYLVNLIIGLTTRRFTKLQN